MFCMACGTPLPDDAQFCLKCGKAQKGVVGSDSAAASTGLWEHNERPPVKISRFWFGFFGPQVAVGKRGFIASRKTVKRHFYVDFQLVDDRGEPTISEGSVQLSVVITQSEKLGFDNRRLCIIKGTPKVEKSDWRFEKETGRPYWRYEWREPIEVDIETFSDNPEAEIGMKFIPRGMSQENGLYLLRKLRADVQA